MHTGPVSNFIGVDIPNPCDPSLIQQEGLQSLCAAMPHTSEIRSAH
jgi:hypothetical protein